MKLLPSLLVGLAPVVALVLPDASAPAAQQEGVPQQEGDPDDLPETLDEGPLEDRPAGADKPQLGGSNLDIFGRPRRSRSTRLEDRLLGCWQMTEMNLAGSSAAGRTAQGFLVISRDFLSLELHAAWANLPPGEEDTSGVPESDIHVSFSAEYTFGKTGILETSTLIGSYIDAETGVLEWERPGYRREYRVEQKTNELILTWGTDGEGANRIVFKPRLTTVLGERDIFGAVKGSAGLGTQLDIFGRPKKQGSGERDVFGKEKELPEGEAPPEEGGEADGGNRR